MPRPRSRISRRPSTRRGSQDVKWANVQLVETVVAAGAQSIFDILGQFTVAQLANIAQIVKIWIDFRYVGNSINLFVHGSFGLHVLTDDAMAVPVTADPGAAFDPDSSWYFIKPWFYLSSSIESIYEHYETKTSRRLPSGSTMAFILENDATSDTSVKYSVNIRTLVRMR